MAVPEHEELGTERDALVEHMVTAALPPALTLDGCIDASTGSFQCRTLLALALGNASDAVEVLSIGYIITVYRDPHGQELSSGEKAWLTAAAFFGMLVGGMVVGAAADRVGRVRCLSLSLAVNAVFGALSAAAPGVGWLVAARVIAGLGVGGSIPAVFTLGAELFPTKMRGAFLSAIASFWMVGSVYAAGCAWLLLGDRPGGGERLLAGGTWRHYAVLATVPALAALVLVVAFVPESPRFLASKGRESEALAVLWRMTGMPLTAEKVVLPGPPPPPSPPLSPPPLLLPRPRTPPHLSRRRRAGTGWGGWGADRGRHGAGPGAGTEPGSGLEAGPGPGTGPGPGGGSRASEDGRGTYSGVQDGGDGYVSAGSGAGVVEAAAAPAAAVAAAAGPSGNGERGGVRSLFSGRGELGRTTTVLVAVWFTLSYGSYGVSTWNNQLFSDVGLSNPYLSSLVYALANLPGNVTSILLVERVGRKRLLVWSMALAAASASLFAAGASGGAGLVVSAAALFNAFSVAGWNCLDALSAESFPTAVRTTGMGLVASAGRLGSIVAQFVNGSLEGNVPLLLLVTAGLMLTGSLVCLLLPRETAGQSLERVLGGDHDDHSRNGSGDGGGGGGG